MLDHHLRAALDAAFDLSLDHLAALDTAPLAATASLPELRHRLGKALNQHSLAPEQVVTELVADVSGGTVGSAGGRFFAWAIGGAVPAALAAEWLTAAWDQNAGLFASGPAAAVVEEVAGEWLKDLLGLPRGCSFALVSGCQMAHATCLAAARHQLLAQRGWDVELKGLAGAPQLHVLASNPHSSVHRAVRLLGIGSDNIANLPLDADEQLTPAILEAALQRDSGAPVIVILQAGDLNTGTFDRYDELIPLAKSHSAWVHIDGAFGLWVGASPQHRHLLTGVDGADSYATDGHKWLNVPYDCGYAFVAHPEAHRAAISIRAPYLIHDADARDQIDWTPEWSRRARGFATYAAIRQLGRDGIASLVERCCDAASAIVEGLSKLPGVEVIWHPTINQGLVRFTDATPGATESDHDRRTDLIIARALAGGKAFFTGTTWHGRRAMRVSVLNWQTNQIDIEMAIHAVSECVRTGN